MKSSEIWDIIDSWKQRSSERDIVKFTMMLDVLVKAGVTIEFNTPSRDPLNEHRSKGTRTLGPAS